MCQTIVRMAVTTLVAAGLSQVVCAAEEPASLKISLDREKDRATVKVESEAALVTITSPTGIGGMQISPVKEWPKKLVLRLELKALEGFRARAGDTEVVGTLSGKSRELLKYNAEGRAESIPNPGEKWPLDISRQKDWIRVEMSTEPFRGEKSLTVQWIDYYR